MALQYSTTYRNALLDQFETTVGVSAVVKFYTGTAPANCATASSGTLLATFSLASDWAANAASGSKSFSNTPITATAAGTGTAGYYRIYDSTSTTCHEQGTLTATGGGGDMTLDNTSITSGQSVSITSWTKTAPGA
jgi:cytochrome c5